MAIMLIIIYIIPVSVTLYLYKSMINHDAYHVCASPMDVIWNLSGGIRKLNNDIARSVSKWYRWGFVVSFSFFIMIFPRFSFFLYVSPIFLL